MFRLKFSKIDKLTVHQNSKILLLNYVFQYYDEKRFGCSSDPAVCELRQNIFNLCLE